MRASLKENASTFPSSVEDAKRLFESSPHLDRLALLRNPRIHPVLVERIFDYEDQPQSLTELERKELVQAFLTNPEALAQSHRLESSTHYSRLWELASRWPIESGVPKLVFKLVGTTSEARAATYKACTDRWLRLEILWTTQDSDRKTIALAMNDSDDGLRLCAYSSFPPYEREIQRVLSGEDKAALEGLALNSSLSGDALEKVRDRLRELSDDSGADDAECTIARKGSELQEPMAAFQKETRTRLQWIADWANPGLQEAYHWFTQAVALTILILLVTTRWGWLGFAILVVAVILLGIQLIKTQTNKSASGHAGNDGVGGTRSRW